MAKIVKEFPLHKNAAIYPWDEWLDGQIWELQQGKDFKKSPYAFRAMLGPVAIRKKVHIKTAVRGDKVFIQNVGPRRPSTVNPEPDTVEATQ